MVDPSTSISTAKLFLRPHKGHVMGSCFSFIVNLETPLILPPRRFCTDSLLFLGRNHKLVANQYKRGRM